MPPPLAAAHHYAYQSVYPKPPSHGPELGPSQPRDAEVGTSHMVDGRRDARFEAACVGEHARGAQEK